ncbi:acyl-CoA dehydrogenase [Nonomuraea sp. NPDC049709]|uniref:acyl-CoA dehydrogenase n=1 Tax=Nonomuraea sp. NPDC049709 TaxID=3154736 RepID=UPI003432036C
MPEALERLLGDPWDPANPLGYAEVVAADERREMFAAAERELDAYGLSAEFVPSAYGGRLTTLDGLVRIMRPVWRRDPTLGLGYGLSSFIAAVNVWTGGSPDQQKRLAEQLLGGGRVVTGYHELAHGNDFARTELTGYGRRLNGAKEVVANARRAESMVVFARTSPEQGSRSHSQFLLSKADLPPDRLAYLPRFGSMGMRGLDLGGIVFTECPMPADALLGSPGEGIETALRSFQVTRIALPAMMVGILDTGLRSVLRFATARRLYGRTAADIPYLRATLAGSFADLLLCDAFCTVAARAVHVLPGEASVHASLVKYIVSKRLIDAMDRLSRVLGAHFYIRQGEYAIFQKLLRDVSVVGFGHAARVACLATVLPQMPRLARRADPVAEGPVAAGAVDPLFRLGADLPPLDFSRLTVTSARGRVESLSAVLRTVAGQAGADPELRRLAMVFITELNGLEADAGQLRPRDLGVDASPDALAVPARFAAVLAAGAVLGMWWHARSGFLADPAWAVAALTRLAADLGHGDGELSGALVERLASELVGRFAGARAFDLADSPVPG